jgi:hypothetical protein
MQIEAEEIRVISAQKPIARQEKKAPAEAPARMKEE